MRTRLADWVSDRGAANRPTVAVTHNGVIRAAYSLATGWDMKDRADIELAWGAAHMFAAGADGRLEIRKLNISLTVSDDR